VLSWGTEEDEDGVAAFSAQCPRCGRFVKQRAFLFYTRRNGMTLPEPNADCRKCGPVMLDFLGWY
jgi:hypothetical protein